MSYLPLKMPSSLGPAVREYPTCRVVSLNYRWLAGTVSDVHKVYKVYTRTSMVKQWPGCTLPGSLFTALRVSSKFKYRVSNGAECAAHHATPCQ